MLSGVPLLLFAAGCAAQGALRCHGALDPQCTSGAAPAEPFIVGDCVDSCNATAGGHTFRLRVMGCGACASGPGCPTGRSVTFAVSADAAADARCGGVAGGSAVCNEGACCDPLNPGIIAAKPYLVATAPTDCAAPRWTPAPTPAPTRCGDPTHPCVAAAVCNATDDTCSGACDARQIPRSTCLAADSVTPISLWASFAVSCAQSGGTVELYHGPSCAGAPARYAVPPGGCFQPPGWPVRLALTCPALPVPPGCAQQLGVDCGAVKGAGAQCMPCVEQHIQDLIDHGCSESHWLEDYCK